MIQIPIWLLIKGALAATGTASTVKAVYDYFFTIPEYKRKIEAYEKKIEELERNVERLESDKNELKSAVQELQNEISAVRSQMSYLWFLNGKHRERIKELETKLAEQNVLIQAKDREIASNKGDIRVQGHQREKLEQKHNAQNQSSFFSFGESKEVNSFFDSNNRRPLLG